MRCPRCRGPLWLESLECEACALPVGFNPDTRRAVDLAEPSRRACASRTRGCPWTLPADSPHAECWACRLTRTRPDPDDAAAMAKLAVTEVSKRRLLIGLADLGLPITPRWLVEGGLAFDLRASTDTERVTIGHASGVITIDLKESLDDHRERLRLNLGEPYRTMLGHFRHEVGHYYQWQLVERPGGALLEECRALFGDERSSYAEAIKRHYRDGAPAGWAQSHISSYATMHPWEDFAETFAHYQHILATLAITANGGLRMEQARQPALPSDVVPRTDYRDASMSEVLADWRWVAHLLNRANHAMGKGDLYPFAIPAPVAEKLAFVHRVVLAAQVEEPFAGLHDGEPGMVAVADM